MAEGQHSGRWPSPPLVHKFLAGEMSFVLVPRNRKSM